MTKEIRLLDLQGLDTKMHISPEMTLQQFKEELVKMLKINPNRYSFSSNGVALEDDSIKILEHIGETNTVTLFNHEIFPEKSFARYNNAFPRLEPKCLSLFQNQPKIKCKETNKVKNKTHNRQDILLQILSSLTRGSGSGAGLSELLSELYRNESQAANSIHTFNDLLDPIAMRGQNPDQIIVSDERYPFEYNSDEIVNEYDIDSQEEDWNDHEDNEGEGWNDMIDIEMSHEEGENRQIRIVLPHQFESLFGGAGIDTAFSDMVRDVGANLTDEQTETLRNICRQTGADLMTALQIFEACDHNEAQTTNLLLSMGV